MSDVEVIKVEAPWCRPCRIYDRVFGAVTRALDIPVRYVNIDEEKETAQLYNVVNIPTTIVLRNGQVVAQREGVLRDHELRSLIGESV